MNRGKPAKYPLVAEAISELIRQRGLMRGDSLPPERELAGIFGCNHLTLRKALQTLENSRLIHTVPSKGSFCGPRPVGSGTAGDLVGFIFPDDEIFYYEIFAAVEKLLNKRNLHPVVHLTGRSRAKEETLLEFFSALNVAALVAVPNTACAELYAQMSMPVVCFDLRLPDGAIPCVLSDEYAGTARAAAHLCELGHRKIAYIGSNSAFDGVSARERLRGFTDTLTKFHVPVNESFIKIKTPTREWGLVAARELFNLAERPTAVCCANDTIAAGVVRYCAGNGLRIPEDCSIVGFGDTRTGQDLGLTSVSQHIPELAEAIVAALDAMFSGTEPTEKTIIPTVLIPRASTGAAQKSEKSHL